MSFDWAPLLTVRFVSRPLKEPMPKRKVTLSCGGSPSTVIGTSTMTKLVLDDTSADTGPF